MRTYKKNETNQKKTDQIINTLKENKPLSEIEKDNQNIDRNYTRNLLRILEKRQIITTTTTRPKKILTIDNVLLESYKTSTTKKQ